MDAETLGSDIVRIQRAARFADTSPEEWGKRLERLIEAQSGLDQAHVSNVRQVGTAAGGSNGTLLFDAAYRSERGEEQRSLVLRFLPAKGLFHTYDVAAQFNLQRALEGSGVPVPPQLWLDPDGEFLERPGYVMAQVRGVSPPMTWMASGVIAEAAPDERRRMMLSYVQALATLHGVDWRKRGLAWMEQRAPGSRPIEREVNWYWDSLLWSASPDYVEMLRPVREWLIAHEPADAETVICHGDANLGNYLFEDGAVSAVVDWEMSFLGAPECDVAFLHVGDQILQSDIVPLEGALTYEAFKAAYEEASGRTLRHMPYFELFTMYRTAIINVLAMKHFPPEVLGSFMPFLEKGPRLCVEWARQLGAPV